MAYIVITPSPAPSSRLYYLTRSNSGKPCWTQRLGEATRFIDEAAATAALEVATCTTDMRKQARKMKVSDPHFPPLTA